MGAPCVGEWVAGEKGGGVTCIVALRAPDGRIVMGADSAGVSGYDLRVRADGKVFRNGPFLIGFTSSFRMGQILRFASLPEQPDDVADERFMCTTFIDAVRHALKEGGCATRESEAESGGQFLVGYKGTIWSVQSDYQVARSVDPFNACGCGESYAIGALAIMDEAIDPAERVRKALEVAERYSAGVRGPFFVQEAA